MFFKHFVRKNQLPGFYISGTLAENGLSKENWNTPYYFCSVDLHRIMEVILKELQVMWIFPWFSNWSSTVLEKGNEGNSLPTGCFILALELNRSNPELLGTFVFRLCQISFPAFLKALSLSSFSSFSFNSIPCSGYSALFGVNPALFGVNP